MSECLFCRIVKGELNAYIVYEDERTMAFLDVHPLAEGHVLVVPKRHLRAFEDLTEEDACALSRAVLKVNGAVMKALGVDSTTIGVNNGGAAGQVVPHLHVHIVPRRYGDGAGTIHSMFKHKPISDPETLKEIAERIRSNV